MTVTDAAAVGYIIGASNPNPNQMRDVRHTAFQRTKLLLRTKKEGRKRGQINILSSFGLAFFQISNMFHAMNQPT
jgi:hypothetical protein